MFELVPYAMLCGPVRVANKTEKYVPGICINRSYFGQSPIVRPTKVPAAYKKKALKLALFVLVSNGYKPKGESQLSTARHSCSYVPRSKPSIFILFLCLLDIILNQEY